jgi:hypothetical protein
MPSPNFRSGRFDTRRFATLVLVGLLLFSAVGGVVGSSGIAAAQQAGPGSGNTTNATTSSGGNTTTAGNVTASTGIGNNSTVANPVNATIQAFKRGDFGYKKLSSGEKKKLRNTLQKLARGNSSFNKNGEQISKIKDILLYHRKVVGIPMDTKPEKSKRVEEIIKKQLGAQGLAGYGTPQTEPFNFTGFNIPSLIDTKLKSLGNSFMQSVPKALKTAYKGIWSTPVPHNSGWHQLLGRPTNFPFQSIHATLLQKYIYPLMSKLLGIGLILIAGAILVNPLSSKYRAKDLFINFVTGVTLYAFSWLIMTTMHAVTDMAIRFIIPNPSKLTQSLDNLLSLGAAPIALSFVFS